MLMNEKRYRKSITLPNGSRKYVSAKSQTELDRKMNELKYELHLGIDIGSDETVAEFTQMWINVYKRPTLKQNSLETLLGTVNTHIMPAIGHMKVRDVKPMHIQQLMSGLTGYSQSVQGKVLKALRAIFNTAMDNGLIVRSPVASNIRAHGEPTLEKVPLSRDQCMALESAVEDTRAFIPVLLALYAGLRREEVFGLKWSDIDFEKHTITVNRANVFLENNKHEIRTTLKSPAAHREIPMTSYLEEELGYAHLNYEYKYGHDTGANTYRAPDGYVCCSASGEAITPSGFRYIWRVIDDLEAKGKLNFHTHMHLLRHTCITRWTTCGLFDFKTVQYLAGHSTPDMTLNTYSHYERESRAADTLRKMQELK